jgi:hypothetical protein
LTRTRLAPSNTLLYTSGVARLEIFVVNWTSLLRSALVLVAITPIVAVAQRETVVHVRVVDSAGKPVANAEVSALRGLATVVAGGATDSAGRRTFSVPRDGQYDAVVRRIGFQRGEQFFTATRDTVSLRVTLIATPQALPAVQVTAEQDAKRRAYHVTADDIEQSTRPIIDGLDVLSKLRPDIIYSRVPDCAARYVWVNGRRIVYPPINEGLAIKARQERRAASILKHIGPTGMATVNLTIQSVMASIHPEHIAEVNFADCNDTSVDKVKGNSAVFVSLKPGVAFEPGIGSYVVGTESTIAADSARIQDVLKIDSADVAFRARLLGVFDDITGDPISGAEVADSTSGTFAVTTSTGTVSLAFLSQGVSTVRVRKPGYVDLLVPVSISPRDTLPLTLVLSRQKQP